jgi:acyl carrier protein
MVESEIAERVESFLRERFAIDAGDPHFTRSQDIFEGAYVDSIGLTELLVFIEGEFGVEVPDEALLSEEFSNIAGIAQIVSRCDAARGSV